MKFPSNEASIRRVNMEEYLKEKDRFELRSGNSEGAPLCPYGNHYEWIGYDKLKGEFIRFTKSVFKILIRQQK